MKIPVVLLKGLIGVIAPINFGAQEFIFLLIIFQFLFQKPWGLLPIVSRHFVVMIINGSWLYEIGIQILLIIFLIWKWRNILTRVEIMLRVIVIILKIVVFKGRIFMRVMIFWILTLLSLSHKGLIFHLISLSLVVCGPVVDDAWPVLTEVVWWFVPSQTYWTCATRRVWNFVNVLVQISLHISFAHNWPF